MKKISSINSTAVMNILAIVLLQGIHVISAPIFSRLMSPSSYGIISIYTTWVSVIALILGFETYGTFPMAKSTFQEDEQKQYQSSVLGLSITIFCLGGIVIAVFPNQMAELFGLDTKVLPVMLLHACGSYCVNFLSMKFIYEFHAKRNLLIAVGSAISTLGISLILVLNMPQETNYWGKIWGMAITESTVGAFAMVYIFVHGRTWFNRQYWKFSIALGGPLLAHSLSGMILNYCDKVMLQRMLDNSQVGIYSIACSLAAIISTIWSALNKTWVPFYFDYFQKEKIEEVKKHGKNYLELFSVLTVGFMLLAPEVFHVMVAEAYWEGTLLISGLALGYYFVFLYSFPANFEIFCKKTKAMAISTVLAGIVNIILNYILISKWGMMGAVIATMLAHLLQFAFHHICALCVRGIREYPFSLRMLTPYTMAVCGVAVWTTFFPGFWLVRWGAGAMIGVIELLRIYKRKSIF